MIRAFRDLDKLGLLRPFYRTKSYVQMSALRNRSLRKREDGNYFVEIQNSVNAVATLRMS